MQKKLTITINETLYAELHKIIGRGNISQFIESLIRPHLLDTELDREYRRMAKDKKREKEAFEWAEATIQDVNDETR